MEVEYVPLLRVLHDLYELPRGMERFQRYLETVTGGTDDVVLPPLVAANPMAKPHVAACIDELLALDAEAVGERAAREAAERLAAVDDDPLKVGLTVADDVAGSWTDRASAETGAVLPAPRRRGYRPGAARNRWVSAGLWSSDAPTADGVRRAVFSALFRAAWLRRSGPPATFGEALDREGMIAAFAGEAPWLADAEVARARTVIAPLAADPDTPYTATFAALFGDAAAESHGYAPLGLPPRAGFAVALADALASGRDPVAALLATPPAR